MRWSTYADSSRQATDTLVHTFKKKSDIYTISQYELRLGLTGLAEEPRPAGVRARCSLRWGPRTAQGEANGEEEAASAEERSRAAGGQQA